MPAPIHYSHKILRLMAEDRKNGNLKGIEPDSKSQVTMLYEKDKPIKVTSVVISTQHSKDLNQEKVRDLVFPYIKKSIPEIFLTDIDPKEIYINPTGQFIIGGPDGDTGLTGRKIIVDTYGGAAPHGGGAFSGKDPSKVDRSAAYASRYVAKNIVAAGLADYCEIQVSYAIGIAKPTSVHVETFDSEKISIEAIVKIVEEEFDLRPKSLINMLDLKRPIYLPTAAYGHFGRSDIDLSWERTDKADQISK
jgi:S-adenosylmethionine synthetase